MYDFLARILITITSMVKAKARAEAWPSAKCRALIAASWRLPGIGEHYPLSLNPRLHVQDMKGSWTKILILLGSPKTLKA